MRKLIVVIAVAALSGCGAAASGFRAGLGSSTRAASSFGDGSWVVGGSVPAGRYVMASDLGSLSDCRWGVSGKGTDFAYHRQQGGGHSDITLVAGQKVTSSGCGRWVRQ
jgi:uncharacterized protein YceK